MLNGVRQETLYLAVQELSAEYPVTQLCKKLKLNRSSYYKWTHREKSHLELENTRILHELGALYAEFNCTYGYRRLQTNTMPETAPGTTTSDFTGSRRWLD